MPQLKEQLLKIIDEVWNGTYEGEEEDFINVIQQALDDTWDEGLNLGKDVLYE